MRWADLRAQVVPAVGDAVDLGLDPARHDVRVDELPPDVLDAGQPLVAVVLDVVLQVLRTTATLSPGTVFRISYRLDTFNYELS